MASLKTIAVPIKNRRNKAAAAAARVEREVEDSAPAEVRRPATPTLAQPTHRYEVGERLRMANGGRSFARAEAYCIVVSRLPFEGRGALLYRVQSETEQYERVVAEIDLSRNQPEDVSPVAD